ncbi:MAG: hypothetical protein PF448_05735 [Bacteroidales bacterium]|nr:hypothetical protein [Bacteroidales bacterium]
MSEFRYDKITLINIKSVITCPKCGFQKEETMPDDIHAITFV